jgi:TolB-like protein
MKFFLTLIVFAVSCSATFAQTNDIDTELSNLAQNLAAQIKDQAKTKVAVIDFTDLDGGTSGELGKYIAEQLTVDLVMDRKGFSVLDRANLKKILDEHKLTAKGLIDPDNAKKLGMFAGVDALILGTIVPEGPTIKLTAKIITTDTAEIVGASRIEFVTNTNVQQLLSVAVPNAQNDAGDSTDDSSDHPKPAKPFQTQRFGNLLVALMAVQPVQNKDLLVTISFENLDTNKTIAVAIYSPDTYGAVGSSLITDDGTKLMIDQGGLTGISIIRANPRRLTPIGPRQTVQASFEFKTTWGLPQNIYACRMECDIIANHDYHSSDYENYIGNRTELPSGCDQHDCIFNISFGKK